jgi:hypothetical protein
LRQSSQTEAGKTPDSAAGIDDLQANEPKMVNSILSLGASKLAKAQGKITYIGTQTQPIRTVLFYTARESVAIEQFRHLQRESEEYVNDRLGVVDSDRSFLVSPSELRRMLTAVGPVVAADDVTAGGVQLSFVVVYQSATGPAGQEFLVGRDATDKFYDKMLTGLDPSNRRGLDAIAAQLREVVPKARRTRNK